ncbi:MAG: NAD-dependent epimerase/dehydratase family protein, partial [Chitinophagaceae bacterium]|nr:NAD-dependent epimerase/dehydratase family protein [Chitinophagaceae bacterium]
MAHVVITGGTGMVGTQLTKWLVAAGHQVTILTRRV